MTAKQRLVRDPSTGDAVEMTVLEYREPEIDPFIARDFSGLTIRQIVEVLMNVYAEELQAMRRIPRITTEQAQQGAAMVWRSQLPELDDRKSVLAFIACIAWGSRMGLLTGNDAKLMMFMAQTQLTAMRPVGGPGSGTLATAGTHPRDPERPPITFCAACGCAISAPAASEFGMFCSAKCMSDKAVRS